MRKAAALHRQEGAVIITVALMMFFLLGFIGIAVDLGRMFVVKTELQTAMDSCALAAAQELDLQPTAIDRAKNAGKAAGNLNAVNFQSGTWSGKGQLIPDDITFRDAGYATTSDPAFARYAQCQHVQPGVQMWLMNALGVFFGNTADYPNTRAVGAIAVATRAPGQTTCPLPVALKPKTTCGGPCPAPDYGFAPGEWITMITKENAFTGGQIGWMSLVDGANGTDKIRDQLKGFCGTKITSQLEPADSGAKTALVEVWNWRFGIYAGSTVPDFTPDTAFMRPDLTGHAYADSGGPNVYSDYAARRQSNEACAASPDACLQLVASDRKLPGTYKAITTAAQHAAQGTNRRIVTVPVINGADKVDGFACVLILHPLSIPMETAKLEYLGNAGSLTSPCTFSGAPGGGAGAPLVPALVE
jgi:hypothetical protein